MATFSTIHCGPAEFTSTLDATGAVTFASTLAVAGAITAPTLVLSGPATLSTHAMRKGEVEAALTAAISGLSYQPLNAQLTAIALLSTTSFGRGLLVLTDAAAARTALGVVIDTDVQAYRVELVKIGARGADIASASTINLETATGDLVDVTGTTGITAVTLSEGHIRRVKFNGILTLTHGSSLILPTAAAITTAVGDIATFAGYAAGVVRLVDYQRADGTPLAGGGGGTLDPAPYNAGSISGSVTLNRANGLFQKATVAASLTLLAPSGGSEGKRLELWLTDSGASGSVDLHASILIPSDSSISFPRTLATGKLHSLILKHNGSNWMLVQFIGGY